MARKAWIVVWTLAFGVGMGACGGNGGDAGTAQHIDWDLSRTHTTKDVHWPDPGSDVVRLSGLSSVRIALPGNREVSMDGGGIHVSLQRSGADVSFLQVDSPKRSAEAALEEARRRAATFGIPDPQLQQWGARLHGSDRSRVVTENVEAPGNDSDRLGANGPVPSVAILHSYDDARPSIVSVRLAWIDLPR